MSKKRGLGRGLDALLGGAEAGVIHDKPTTTTAAETTSVKVANDNGLKLVPIDKIHRGTYQPRRHFDEEALQELADSLISQGMIQPVVLRPHADGYELIAGERRWRAAQLAGLQEIPAVIKKYNDSDAAAVSLIENIQRENLNPLEEAAALSRLQEEFDMTHQQVAEAIGRSRSSVSNLLRLLELHEDVKHMVDAKQLEMGHARALLSIEKNQQHALAIQIVEKGLSVRATEALVKSSKNISSKPVPVAKTTQAIDPDIQALILRLSDTLGSNVNLQHSQTGAGKLEISYSSLDELDGILSHIH